MSAKEYLFPFSTCEKPCDDCNAKQPYSTIINLLNTLTLFIFLFRVKTLPFQLIIGTLIAFEAYHTYSHITHIPGNIQQNVQHFIVYIIILTTIFALQQNKPLPTHLILLFTVLFLIDLYIYVKIKKVFMILSGSILYITIFAILYYRLHLSKDINNLFRVLILFIIVIIILVINEAMNCKKMMDIYEFPYHIMIEILGLIVFIIMGIIYCKIENKIMNLS
jgi:hypothetical protein